jgi:hypothetical protein
MIPTMVNKEELSKYLAALGKKGGKSTARRLTAAERSESARRASQARWAKAKAAK